MRNLLYTSLLLVCSSVAFAGGTYSTTTKTVVDKFVDVGPNGIYSDGGYVSHTDAGFPAFTQRGTGPGLRMNGVATEVDLGPCISNFTSDLNYVRSTNQLCYCNGSEWRCAATINVDGGTNFVGIAPISISGPAISCVPASGVAGGCLTADLQSLPGGKTFVGDGGVVSGVTADHYFAVNVPYGTSYGPWQDGGSYVLGGYNCGSPPGLASNGLWEHGVPCVTDYTGPMEVTANYPDVYYDGDDICTIELTTPPQNPRVAGCNMTVMNGPQKNFWVRHDGSMWTLGNMVFHNSGGHYIRVDQSPGSISLQGNIPSGIGFDFAALYSSNSSALGVNSYIHSFFNSGQPQAAIDYAGAVEVHVPEATVAWDHVAAFQQFGHPGDYPAAFGASVGKEWGHKLDCPAFTDGGAGTIAYFEDAGWGVCDTNGWHRLALVP